MEGRIISDEQKAMLLWKLAPGDANKVLSGEDPRPCKDKVAGPGDWRREALDEAQTAMVNMGVTIPSDAMAEILKGHIPEKQEDHWFMYCDGNVIRWIRSWTGIQVFEAAYRIKDDGNYVVDTLKVTLGIPEVPFSGAQSAGSLFMMLMAADAGINYWPYWEEYISALEKGV